MPSRCEERQICVHILYENTDEIISLVTNILLVINIDRPEHNRGVFLGYFFKLRGVYIVTSHLAFL